MRAREPRLVVEGWVYEGRLDAPAGAVDGRGLLLSRVLGRVRRAVMS